jgi:hypothetical protein
MALILASSGLHQQGNLPIIHGEVAWLLYQMILLRNSSLYYFAMFYVHGVDVLVRMLNMADWEGKRPEANNTLLWAIQVKQLLDLW